MVAAAVLPSSFLRGRGLALGDGLGISTRGLQIGVVPALENPRRLLTVSARRRGVAGVAGERWLGMSVCEVEGRVSLSLHCKSIGGKKIGDRVQLPADNTDTVSELFELS